jgi:hypothetical protein
MPESKLGLLMHRGNYMKGTKEQKNQEGIGRMRIEETKVCRGIKWPATN